MIKFSNHVSKIWLWLQASTTGITAHDISARIFSWHMYVYACFKKKYLTAAWLSWSSARLVIKRLWNLGSTPDVVVSHCTLGKDT